MTLALNAFRSTKKPKHRQKMKCRFTTIAPKVIPSNLCPDQVTLQITQSYACQTGSKCRRVIFKYRVAIIYVQITLYISKVQYICPKLRYVYPNPATCFRFMYNSQMILHISIQFRYKYFTDFSRYIFHAVSISCKSTWPVPHLASMTCASLLLW